MSEVPMYTAPLRAAQAPAVPATERDEHAVDWRWLEQSAAFRDLVLARRRFVLPAAAFFLSSYLGFLVLAGYAHDLMATRIGGGWPTIGLALTILQFAVTWVVAALYTRRADRRLDPAARRVLDLAAERSGAVR
jgi:uncharacterized membrane protein (DUF485 family)